MESQKKTRVLIVDDSALMRKILGRVLSEDPGIEIVGAAPDPFFARQMIKELKPDVITLDIEMPRMDGISFLERIMRLRPMPVVMVSTLTQKGADVTLQALEMGAVDFIGKPKVDVESSWLAMKGELIAKVKIAARSRVLTRNPSATAVKKVGMKRPAFSGTHKIVAIGASTGGVEALREVICALPADGPPIVIAQHIPPTFATRFAERLDGISAMKVTEAVDGRKVLPGHVLIAPGDKHLRIRRSGGNYLCSLGDDGLVSGHKPSVDALFHSVADQAGSDAVGVILTGMGKDGAQGLLEMRNAGAKTLCQDEATSLIYGMPKAAMSMGAVEQEKPLSKIAEAILDQACGGTNATRATGGRQRQSEVA